MRASFSGRHRAGTYQLQTVNGQSLPANPGLPLAGAPDIISRALTLKANGTCDWVENHRHLFPPFEQDFETATGTYTRSGDTVEVSLPPRTVMPMVFTDGNTLTYTQVMDAYQHVYVYRK